MQAVGRKKRFYNMYAETVKNDPKQRDECCGEKLW